MSIEQLANYLIPYASGYAKGLRNGLIYGAIISAIICVPTFYYYGKSVGYKQSQASKGVSSAVYEKRVANLSLTLHEDIVAPTGNFIYAQPVIAKRKEQN